MFKKLINWWRNNHQMFIVCDTTASSVILSKQLYKSMLLDHQMDDSFNVLFTKMRNVRPNGHVMYAMFFNPQWEKHGVSNPRQIQTIPVTWSKQGHIGFQSVQPTCQELAAMYGIEQDKFRLKISKHYINEEPYYLIER